MAFESRHIGNNKGGSGMIIRVLLMGAILVAFVLMLRKLPGVMTEVADNETTSEPVTATYWPESNLPVIQHSTFTLTYDEEHEQAKWVAYVLTKKELNRQFVDRTDWFEMDEAIPTGSSEYYDYKGSGYTKGHLIPSADRAWNRAVNEETFLMSNISPQAYNFNGGVWRELEENVRDWARSNDRLYIVTGPIIGKSTKTIGENQVTVPERFFKVILDFDEPELKAIGFIIPNAATDLPLSEFAMPVRSVEEQTGIDFYNQLIQSDSLEKVLESNFELNLWPVDENRYRMRVDKWNR
ncbi:DNA/RNA non-specific endonuclease [Membranicola marinus]|uniref:DNA/RNA non-specific endonuclease n=1 Tax=Membranihabitans marinus TaxID=1227546 RepID=A0A953LA48_9BACT|nr:DNA/RNA non-specific endonuclease [Membranihabitans marinus]MBY5957266.1 DNA/RNA non-specific endonuclease [Membranihabitans marinus]